MNTCKTPPVTRPRYRIIGCQGDRQNFHKIKDQIPILNHFLETKKITEMYCNKKELESQT